MDDIVGVAEIAERLGVGVNAVHQWHRRYADFPKPVMDRYRRMLGRLPAPASLR